MNRYMLLLILLVALVLRVYKLDTLMQFVGDQAWFYLSARDALLTGDIPLVGITASRTWLHQGPYWTYMLMPILWFADFHPVAPAYVTALLGVVTSFGVYLVGRKLFSERVGLWSSIVYATSPLIVMSDRMPYDTAHTALISLGIFYALYEFIHGNDRIMPLGIALLVLAYTINIAGVILWVPVGLYILWGLLQKSTWLQNGARMKNLVPGALVGIGLMLPLIVYDMSQGIQKGFPQTIKFFAWFVSRPVLLIFEKLKGASETVSDGTGAGQEMILFVIEKAKFLIFLPHAGTAFLIGLLSIAVVLITSFKDIRKGNFSEARVMLLVFVVLVIAGIIGNGTPSEAYMPALFPLMALLIALAVDVIGASLDSIYHERMSKGYIHIAATVCIIVVSTISAASLVQQNYLLGTRDMSGRYGPSFEARKSVVEDILVAAGGRPFALQGKGDGAQFESFTMNSEYIAWWLGQAPVAPEEAEKTFVIMYEEGLLSWEEL